jgi:proline iminopeptidase
MKKIVVIIGMVYMVGCDMISMDTVGALVPPAVDQDSELPSVEVNGTLLHAETFGDIHNPIIIFLHGGPGGDYRALISEIGQDNASRYPSERTASRAGMTRLQDDYFLVFYDQRSAGLSQRHSDVSFQDYIADLNALVEYYSAEKYHQTGISDNQVSLFAWSFGGILATGFLNQYPDKFENVVFYEPGPFGQSVWDYFKANTTSVFAQVGKDWLEEYLLSKDHLTPDSHERADYQLMVNVFRAQPEFHEHPDTPLWRFGALLADDNLDFAMSTNYDISSNIARSYNGNALFIAGSKTVDELPEYMGMQMENYPNAAYKEIQGTGHTGPWEKPAEIVSLVRSFIKSGVMK